jgi:phosphopantothenoylcysteine decarboxylase/phosphopantothenate--cysteine ligase
LPKQYRVVLGVSGGIAAYKAAEVCRRLVDAGVHVAPVLTADAQRFVGPLTFSALASEPARTSLWDAPEPIPHTRLGQSADLIVVAPATANVIGKYAAGISDDLLTATLLATRTPVLMCPAMHTEMWEHAAVQDNIATLRRRGVHVLEPEQGRLAGGDVGAGRLAEPARIAETALALLGAAGGPLTGTSLLVTAGGTREAIDPVRFVGNRSSGKMGHAIAQAAARRGARVTLVTTTEPPAGAAFEVVRVESAEDMHDAVVSRAPHVDVVVMAAAVADFRPKAIADQKLKKGDGVPDVVLEPTTDILAALGRAKRSGQYLVGFAAETERIVEHAQAKLAAKNVDLMVANDVSADDSGFEVDTNRAVLLDSTGDSTELPLLTKDALAGVILDHIAINMKQPTQERP